MVTLFASMENSAIFRAKGNVCREFDKLTMFG
jgi:hypothetical protein